MCSVRNFNMSDNKYDVIVVGAGVEGSSTAYQLAKRGKKVLLLEQFPLPHTRGSSHGQSRITRKAYGAKDFYTEMMKDAYRLTDELQREAGEQLFINCGCLIMGNKDNPFLRETESALVRHKVSHRKINPVTHSHVYPQFKYNDEDSVFILDHSGGLLKAEKILAAYQNQFRKYGGVIRDGEPMTEIVPGTNVIVKTEKGMYTGTSVVLALGPWAAQFLPKLGVNVPLKPLRILVMYWKAQNPAQFEADNFPTFVDCNGSAPNDIYGLPSYEYPGLVKVCLHAGPEIDPNFRDTADSNRTIQRVKDWVSKHIPALDPEPCIVEPCIYTNTPDGDYVLDQHPKWDNVIIGAGFSGHGFKLAPVVGTILADMATKQTPKYDMSPFKISRFLKHKL